MRRAFHAHNKTKRSSPTPEGDIVYGALYNFYVAENPLLINPSFSEWRVPREPDLEDFFLHIDPASDINFPAEYMFSLTAGGKLKAINNWNAPNTGASDIYNFSSNGSGYRQANGVFDQFGNYTEYWVIKEGASFPRFFELIYVDEYLYYASEASEKWGWCIRLMRPATVSEQLLDDGASVDGYTGNDGRVYPAVKIGSQAWMSVNLAETKYTGGVSIPIITDNTEWASDTDGAMCYIDNDPLNI